MAATASRVPGLSFLAGKEGAAPGVAVAAVCVGCMVSLGSVGASPGRWDWVPAPGKGPRAMQADGDLRVPPAAITSVLTWADPDGSDG